MWHLSFGQLDEAAQILLAVCDACQDVLHAFERACGRDLPYRIQPRRPGDIDMCFADPGLALAELGWKTEYDLDDMCRDSWNWQQQNPNGY